MKERETRVVNGVVEFKCASCEAFKPGTREHYYMQRSNGKLRPHSWCKPCYATNSGRGAGMRVRDDSPQVPEEIRGAQAAFLRLPVPSNIATADVPW